MFVICVCFLRHRWSDSEHESRKFVSDLSSFLCDKDVAARSVFWVDIETLHSDDDVFKLDIESPRRKNFPDGVEDEDIIDKSSEI